MDTEPMIESKFFVLDEEQNAFFDFVNKIEASGGGDEAGNALETLALAMNSDWVQIGDRRRHIILMYTSAPALKLGERKDTPGYPSNMPMDFAELREWWEGGKMDKRAKRLIIFAPDIDPWSDMVDWSNTSQYVSKAGAGCDDMDIEVCINLLVNSI